MVFPCNTAALCCENLLELPRIITLNKVSYAAADDSQTPAKLLCLELLTIFQSCIEKYEVLTVALQFGDDLDDTDE